MIKKIAWAAVAALTLGGIVTAGFHQLKSDSTALRVAFPSGRKDLNYDPAKIHFAYEYLFLENVYSPLVEMDKNGNVVPGLAESYKWEGNNLHLTLRSDMKTADGHVITARDAEFSLKRLLVLASNTHGNFKDVVCPGITLKTVEEKCPGISVQGNTLVLNAGNKGDFLLPMLAAIDFAVIPQHAVDPATLEMKDFTETSGLYRFESMMADGTIRLIQNQNHYHAVQGVAKEVHLVQLDRSIRNQALRLFENNEVDHVMTSNMSQIEALLEYAKKESSSVNAHATMNIRTTHLVFTERGWRELSDQQRASIGAAVKGAFTEIYKNRTGYEIANDFFPAAGAGGLDAEQEQMLGERKHDDKNASGIHFRLGLIKAGDLEEWSKPLQQVVPGAVIYREEGIPDLKSYDKSDDVPHAFIASVDTGFREDIGLITHAMSAGYLGFTKEERAEWLTNYMQTPEKTDRMKKLRKLHYNVLAQSILVPLVVSPFVALARKPWRIELSPLYANNQLWLIKHD